MVSFETKEKEEKKGRKKNSNRHKPDIFVPHALPRNGGDTVGIKTLL
jgi:hypothetical protein